MSDTTLSKTMLEKYKQEATPTMFMFGFFKSPARNFFKTEKVEYDITRSDEDVSVAVQDISAAYRENADTIFTNKQVTPAVHSEGATLSVFNLMGREAGETAYDTADFQLKAMRQVTNVMRKMENKIRRAQEMQASQILTTGKVTLTDKDGKVMYTADFMPKATHFFNAGTAWDQAAADPLGDIEAGCDLVRDDGLADPDVMLMGTDSFEALIKNGDVLKRLDVRNLSVGGISAMTPTGKGGKFRGTLEVGDYKLDIYTYNGRYKHPQTGVKTRFLPGDKVVIMPSDIRLDACFGEIPRFDAPAGSEPALRYMPGSFPNPEGGMGLSVYAWFTPDRKALTVEVGTRFVCIPTAIDQLVCIDTGL